VGQGEDVVGGRVWAGEMGNGKWEMGNGTWEMGNGRGCRGYFRRLKVFWGGGWWWLGIFLWGWGSKYYV